MKTDEKLLLTELQGYPKDDRPYVRDVVRALEMPPKRAAYICEKWSRRGLYEYGVNVLAGWLTDEGYEEMDNHT